MAKCYQKQIELFSLEIKEITKTKTKTQMRTKNNTNQQIIPTHNRDNENCDITDKKEYEVNLVKKYFLINFSCFRKT